MNYTESEVIAAIKAQFKNEENFRFLKGEWKKRRKESNIPETGFCYLGTCAYFLLMGGEDSGLKIKRWREKSDPIAGHFWIEKQNGDRLDLTMEQYPNGFQKYADGVTSRRKPSSTAVKFTEAVINSLTKPRIL